MKIFIIIPILIILSSCNNIPLDKEKLLNKPIRISINKISSNKTVIKMNEFYEKYSETNIVGYENTDYGKVATNVYGEYIIEDWDVYYNLLLRTLKNQKTNDLFKFGKNVKRNEDFPINFNFNKMYNILLSLKGYFQDIKVSQYQSYDFDEFKIEDFDPQTYKPEEHKFKLYYIYFFKADEGGGWAITQYGYWDEYTVQDIFEGILGDMQYSKAPTNQ